MDSVTKEKIGAGEFQVVPETLSVPYLLSPYFDKAKVSNYLMLKRIADVTIASILTVAILSWLYPVLAALIRLSSKGGTIFTQKRVGQNGKVFNCFKFRTMRINDDADLKEAQMNDQRITTLGRWLRNTYIDELPQLINVLAGNMSIVGPRPHMMSHHFKLCSEIPLYDQRHLVKPGITGLAQVKGYHGAMQEKCRVEGRTKLDLFYLRKMSLGLDMMILIKTISIVLPFNVKK